MRLYCSFVVSCVVESRFCSCFVVALAVERSSYCDSSDVYVAEKRFEVSSSAVMSFCCNFDVA